MTEFNVPDPAGSWALTGTGIAGVGLALYKFWRQFKKDQRDDSKAETEGDLIDNLRSEIDRLQKRLSDQDVRLDNMADQRNKTMVENARLEAEIKAIREQNENLKAEADRIRKELDDYKSSRGTMGL